MATTGNSTDFGDLTTASQDSDAAANNTSFNYEWIPGGTLLTEQLYKLLT